SWSFGLGGGHCRFQSEVNLRRGERAKMAREPRSLRGKVVAITGGARGIGKATARALILKGPKVAIGDLDKDLAEQSAAELGGDTLALELDVTRRDSFEGFLDQVEERL